MPLERTIRAAYLTFAIARAERLGRSNVGAQRRSGLRARATTPSSRPSRRRGARLSRDTATRAGARRFVAFARRDRDAKRGLGFGSLARSTRGRFAARRGGLAQPPPPAPRSARALRRSRSLLRGGHRARSRLCRGVQQSRLPPRPAGSADGSRHALPKGDRSRAGVRRTAYEAQRVSQGTKP